MTTIPWQGRRSSRNARILAWMLLLLPIAIVLVYPFARDYLLAASLLKRISDPNATGWLASYEVHPVDVRDITFSFRGSQVPAHVYVPRGVGFAPGIVVVHGMHRMGMDGPRLVSFARAFASGGFFVMTPQVPGIADYRVEAESAELVGTAAASFAKELNVPKVGILAISFSGGLSLLAASDPQYFSSIGWVASVGGYYNLAHVLRFFATGEAVRPDGSVEHMRPHEYGPLIVIYDEPQDFFAAQDVQTAHDALKLLLAEQVNASEVLANTLTLDGQQIMQRIYHKQRESFVPAILDEVDKRQQQLASASPAGHLQALHVPILLLHGSDDVIIPPTEMLWLQHELPRAYLRDALVSPAIGHVDLGAKIKLRDRLALIHWIALMIREARTAGDGQDSSMHLPAGLWLAAASENTPLSRPW